MNKKSVSKGTVKNKSGFLNSNYAEKIGIGVIILLTFLVYFNTFNNGFCWDDHNNIIDNNDLHETSLHALIKIVSTPYLEMFTPVTNITYFLNYSASKLHPAFYHFINLLLHIIAVLLLYRFIKLLSGRADAAIAGTLLFAIHPMNVETVAWISARSTLLYCIFLICSLINYVKHIRFNQRKNMLLSLLFFILSCFSKPSAVVLPLLLFAIDFYEKRKLNVRLVFEKTAFFIIALVFGIITIHIRVAGEVTNLVYDQFTLPDRFFITCYAFSNYLVKFLLPVNLCNAFGIPVKTGNNLPPEYYLSVLVLGVMCFLAFRRGHYRHLFQFSFAFYVISLLLVVQIIPFGRDLVADRYSYLPYIGICFIAGVFLGDVYQKKITIFNLSSRTVFLLSGGIIIIFSSLSWQRNKVWKDDLTLFKDAIKKQPGNFFPYYFIGTYHTNYGDPNEAIRYLNSSLEINPLHPEAYNNRAIVKGRTGDATGAIEDYTRSLKLNPVNPFAYYSRGTLFGALNKFEEAKRDLDSAIRQKPDYGDAYFNRGMANLSLHLLSNACEDWKKSLKYGNEFAKQRLDENCK